MKYYTGVGSRKTPGNIIGVMVNIAYYLSLSGWTLRSGGARGADTAFEQGLGQVYKEIYYAKDATKEAMAISAEYHPAWNKCSQYAKQLHGRNAFQVLGKDLATPSSFLICWTPDGCETHATRGYSTGGTGTAISIANAYNIPVYNLANIESFNLINHWIVNQRLTQ